MIIVKRISRKFIPLFFLTLSFQAFSQNKPNILWLTVEDMSPYLSSYGNEFTHTPTLDSLAKHGIRFTRAYSNGTQCSPARSTLISSNYAPSMGTDWHRKKRAFPEDFYYPIYLNKAGYYCTNNSKRDYNTKHTPKNVWDKSSRRATYLNRPEGTPFFAIFNHGGTHTSRIATRDVKGRSPRTIQPSEVKLPPYLPDEPWIREDIAWHYDSVNEMDRWVAKKLKELRKSGEAENTIIFFYSDHGGVLPRSKAYLYETGACVPLIIYFPEKYKHLANIPVPSVSDRMVSFIDFAPTLLSLAGVEVPDFMQGKPFLGEQSVAAREEIFLFRTNQSHTFIPSRAIIDGKYKFIWNFNPAYPNGSRQPYQWQMPSYQAWDEACMQGKCNELQQRFWEPMKAWELYNIQKDPMEINNLAYKPEYQALAKKYSKKLLEKIYAIKDLGLYPRSMRDYRSKVPIYYHVRRADVNVKKVIHAAAMASTADVENIDELLNLLQYEAPAVRYWGAMGILQLVVHKGLDKISQKVLRVYRDPEENMETRLIIAEALVKAENDKQALDFIIDQVARDNYSSYAVLQNLGELAKPAEERIIKLYDNKKMNRFYLRSALINTGYIPYDRIWKRS